MRVPLGSDGWYLCDWSDRPDYEYMELQGSKTLTVQWANQFRDDLFALCTLRRLLGGAFPPRSDQQVARELASRLTGGAWVARRPVVKRESPSERLPEVAAAFPKEERRAPAPPRTPGPEAPLFPGDIDPAAIAEGQKKAAALGVPFCEECLRAQLAAR